MRIPITFSLSTYHDGYHHHDDESLILVTLVHPVLCYYHNHALQRTGFVHHISKTRKQKTHRGSNLALQYTWDKMQQTKPV